MTEFKVPILHVTVSADVLLTGYIQKGFPRIAVKIEPKFLSHIETAYMFSRGDLFFCAIYAQDDSDRAVFMRAMELARASVLKGHLTLSMVRFFGQHRFGLEIAADLAPRTQGEQVERNLVLGCAPVEGVNCYIIMEHVWKNVQGSVRKEVRLRARPVEGQSWVKENKLSVLALGTSVQTLEKL